MSPFGQHWFAALSIAGATNVSFLDNPRYLNDFCSSDAGAAFVTSGHADKAPAGMAVLVTETPYLAYAKISQLFYPNVPVRTIGVHPTASVAPLATIGEGCQIDAGVVIGAGASIGARCRIAPNAVQKSHDELSGSSVALNSEPPVLPERHSRSEKCHQ